MLEILAHSNLPHEAVLVSVHASELPNVIEGVLQAICQLIGINITQPVLNVRIYHKLCQSQYLSRKVECITKSTLLPLLCCKSLGWLEIKVVVEMQVIQLLSINEQIEHVVALATYLQPNLYPIQLRTLKELGCL